MISWTDYVQRFTENYDALKNELLEPGSKECCGGPVLKCTMKVHPNSAPFRSEWGAIFDDGYYFRVYENFERVGRPNAGKGIRKHFSFHYGKAHPKLDSDGFPFVQKPETPVPVLRVDLDRWDKPHVHINSRDHIYQSRIRGYSIRDADMFRFLRSVVEHRKEKKPLHELLNIAVKR